jgi:5'-nucleotidase, C-terminal domain
VSDASVVRRLTRYAKGLGTAIGVLGTAIATLFLLIDHGVLGGRDGDPSTDVVNTALRQLDPPLASGCNQMGECALGDLVADARRHATRVQIAFVNPGAIRAPIKGSPDIDVGQGSCGMSGVPVGVGRTGVA